MPHSCITHNVCVCAWAWVGGVGGVGGGGPNQGHCHEKPKTVEVGGGYIKNPFFCTLYIIWDFAVSFQNSRNLAMEELKISKFSWGCNSPGPPKVSHTFGVHTSPPKKYEPYLRNQAACENSTFCC